CWPAVKGKAIRRPWPLGRPGISDVPSARASRTANPTRPCEASPPLHPCKISPRPCRRPGASLPLPTTLQILLVSIASHRARADSVNNPDRFRVTLDTFHHGTNDLPPCVPIGLM